MLTILRQIAITGIKTEATGGVASVLMPVIAIWRRIVSISVQCQRS